MVIMLLCLVCWQPYGGEKSLLYKQPFAFPCPHSILTLSDGSLFRTLPCPAFAGSIPLCVLLLLLLHLLAASALSLAVPTTLFRIDT